MGASGFYAYEAVTGNRQAMRACVCWMDHWFDTGAWADGIALGNDLFCPGKR